MDKPKTVDEWAGWIGHLQSQEEFNEKYRKIFLEWLGMEEGHWGDMIIVARSRLKDLDAKSKESDARSNELIAVLRELKDYFDLGEAIFWRSGRFKFAVKIIDSAISTLAPTEQNPTQPSLVSRLLAGDLEKADLKAQLSAIRDEVRKEVGGNWTTRFMGAMEAWVKERGRLTDEAARLNSRIEELEQALRWVQNWAGRPEMFGGPVRLNVVDAALTSVPVLDTKEPTYYAHSSSPELEAELERLGKEITARAKELRKILGSHVTPIPNAHGDLKVVVDKYKEIALDAGDDVLMEFCNELYDILGKGETE